RRMSRWIPSLRCRARDWRASWWRRLCVDAHLHADRRDDLLDEPPRGGQVLEVDLEMADADIHEPLNLGDDLRSRRPEVVEGVARLEVVVVRRLEGGRIVGHAHRDTGREHDLLARTPDPPPVLSDPPLRSPA